VWVQADLLQGLVFSVLVVFGIKGYGFSVLVVFGNIRVKGSHNPNPNTKNFLHDLHLLLLSEKGTT